MVVGGFLNVIEPGVARAGNSLLTHFKTPHQHLCLVQRILHSSDSAKDSTLKIDGGFYVKHQSTQGIAFPFHIASR